MCVRWFFALFIASCSNVENKGDLCAFSATSIAKELKWTVNPLGPGNVSVCSILCAMGNFTSGAWHVAFPLSSSRSLLMTCRQSAALSPGISRRHANCSAGVASTWSLRFIPIVLSIQGTQTSQMAAEQKQKTYDTKTSIMWPSSRTAGASFPLYTMVWTLTLIATTDPSSRNQVWHSFWSACACDPKVEMLQPFSAACGIPMICPHRTNAAIPFGT